MRHQFIHSFAASASATPHTPAVARADFSSLGSGDVGVISLSTKYKELGQTFYETAALMAKLGAYKAARR